MTAVARLMLAAVATLMSTPTVGEDELTGDTNAHNFWPTLKIILRPILCFHAD